MATAATFTLDAGRLVLFGDAEGASSGFLGAGVVDGADAAAVDEAPGLAGLTIMAGSGVVRVMRAFLDQPRYQREPRRRRR